MDYRALFEGIDQPIHDDSCGNLIPIGFDNGATTPPMKCVCDEIAANIKQYGSISRGEGYKSNYCTNKFEAIRDDILDFFHLKATNTHTVIYVKSATEGLNLLAHSLSIDPEKVILTTRMEHHANMLPWRHGASRLDYIEVDQKGRIQKRSIENKLRQYRGKVSYVTITAASNVTGYVNDINGIAAICHRYGAKIIVDAAQLVAHREINMAGKVREEQIDFLVFSAHKVYAPFGAGAVIGLKDILNNVDPYIKGGSAVDQVFDDSETWLNVPERLEAGTQNFFGVVGMGAALKELKKIGFANIVGHEAVLRDILIFYMQKMPHVILYGDCKYTKDRLGVIGFNVKGMTHNQVSKILAKTIGVETRNGKFCAHPYVTRLLHISNLPENEDEQDTCGMVRISLGLYNTQEEVYRFLKCLESIYQWK